MALKVGYEAGRPGPKRTRRLEGIIIHATKGGPESGALEKVKKAEKGVTWHFTITRDGKIYQHVALSHIAGHAGDGILDVEGKRIKDVNAVTLGIELGNWGPHVIETVEGASGANKTKVFRYLPVKPSVNRHRPERSEQILPMPGYLLEQVGTLPLDGRETPMWWEKYPEAQIDALVALIKRLQTTQWAHATAKIVGHDAVALNPRGRKVDPGANFPWHRILPLAIQQSTKEEPFGVQKPRKPEG